jgi:hypothetical protein
MRARLLRASLFNSVQVLAAFTGIAGFGLAVAGDVSRAQRTALGLSTLAAVTVITVAALILRRRPLRPIRRDEMVRTGERLLEHGVNDAAVMFAGDMSWANEYSGAVAHAVKKGKRITVVYPEAKGEVAENNARVLRTAGAEVLAVRQDSRLRAMLVDYDDPAQALLYVVTRRRGTRATNIGHLPDSEEYEAKIYRWKEDSLLITTATKLFQALVPGQAPQVPSSED